MQGPLDIMNLNEYWKQVLSMGRYVRSLTVAFRPNDPTYTKDINPRYIKIPSTDADIDIEVDVLSVVKRNAQLVSELFLALGNYSRRTFVCTEPTMGGMEFCHPEESSMPKLLLIPSCSTLHDICKNKLTCEAVRCSQVIKKYMDMLPTTSQKSVYVVVDTSERRNRLVNAFMFIYEISVKFVDVDGRFLTKLADEDEHFCGKPSDIVILTAEQVLGYHMHDILILDLPKCTWRNYVRMLSTSRKNTVIAIELEALQVGKYSYINEGMSQVLETMHVIGNDPEFEEGLRENLNIAFTIEEQKMMHLDENVCQTLMTGRQEMAMQDNFEVRRHGPEEAAIDLKRREESIKMLNVIFGHSSSGKSSKLLDIITSLTCHGQAQHKIILLHMGSTLSKEVSVDHLNRLGKENQKDLFFIRSKALSPIGIINHDVVKDMVWRHNSEKIYIHVDDYSIQCYDTGDEIKLWEEILKYLRKCRGNLILTVVFQPHAKGGRRISMSRLMSFFCKEEKGKKDVKVIKLPEHPIPCFTNPNLLLHITRNETHTSLDLEAKSIHTTSRPGAWVSGPMPTYIKCVYKCIGHHKNHPCHEEAHIYVLVSDLKLMDFLQATTEDKTLGLEFVHPEDFRGYDERSMEEAIRTNVAYFYQHPHKKAYSLPEGYILNDKIYKEMKEKAEKCEDDEMGEEEMDMSLYQQSVALVFDRLKEEFKDVHSLTIADYAFTDTLLRVMNQTEKDDFMKMSGINKEYFESGAHDVFEIGISGQDILGLFFQIEGTTSNTNPKTAFELLKKATHQVLNDINTFRTICGKFSISFVKLAGFAAFPKLRESDLQKLIKCRDCRARILTSEDLKDPISFKRNIFNLYVCAASIVDMPRSPTQLYTMSEKHMKLMLVILTPQQRELVKSESNVILMTGTSGTGKTFVLKKRALQLAKKDEVLVLNISGGDLTEDFRYVFKDAKKEIEVIDGREGREKGLEEDLQGFKEFLKEKGRGKHVLIDEVPLTLGFPDIITPKALSDHWNWIETLDVKSITVCFRPNDQSYTRDFPLEEVKPAGHSITVLDSVKRNTRKISELFMAIGNYSRRVFVSYSPSLKIDSEEIGGECLPRFISMTSCQALHRKCKDESICECVRASHVIYEECRKASEKRPVFVVVDEIRRRNAFLNTFMSLYPEFPVLFLWRGDFHGKPPPEGSFPLVVVTEEEMIGCHPLNVTVVLDFPRSQWENYNRLIASTRENKILVIEDEAWRTGKFSHVPTGIKETPGWKIEDINIDKESLNAKLEKIWKGHVEEDLEDLDERKFPKQSFPRIEMDWDDRGEEDADVAKMLASSLSGIFGYPASGKSRKINLLIGRVTSRVLILNCRGKLSRLVYRQRWKGKENVELDEFSAGHFDFPNYLFKRVEEREKNMKEMEKGKKRKKKAKGSKKTGKEKAEGKREETGEKTEPDPLVVVVEDCYFFDQFPENTVELLKKMKMKLILAFEPHSTETPDISVEQVVEMLNKRLDCTAIVLRSELSNLALMRHIRENETPIALDLKSKNLSVSALPASIVPGPPVEYVNIIKAEKCPGRHLGYICSGNSTCGMTANALSSLLRSEPFESTNEAPQILVSEEWLLTPLREKMDKTWPRIQVKHIKDFRGCEASTVISFNVNDDWLLEVISRSRTRLVVIDDLRRHQNLWKQMKKEGRVVPISCPTDPEDDLRILLRLDDQEMFLERPTWDEASIRVGEKAMQILDRDILDRDTGAIRFLPPETLAAIDEKLSLSSPFSGWGYVWSGLEGEVPAVDIEKSEKILKVLKQNGVEWHERYPPVALKTRTGSGAAGFLETMSLLLTGSLLHFPLLKKLCGAELKDDKDSDLLGKNEEVRKYILTSRREAERRMNLQMREDEQVGGQRSMGRKTYQRK
ncbi:unnamed protein product [Darwinula stevensoni]|uniref:Uncharacterized protein n=1 Tax=Darwinula stevensoni TaxID=69355 RepID=A0A7R9A697_9CRUS|nr:unnamed protein product [Darwinula stevensoni]CAG0888478.1 unnamed protein product [Darwinula stevensoni]